MHFYRMTDNTYSKTSDALCPQPDILGFELNNFPISLNCVNDFMKVYMQKVRYRYSISSKAHCLLNNLL